MSVFDESSKKTGDRWMGSKKEREGRVIVNSVIKSGRSH